MMAIDVGKFLRLKGAIQGAMDAVPTGSAAFSGTSLVDAYLTLRKETAEAIPEELAEEFDRQFKPSPFKAGSGMRSIGAGQAQTFNEARALLGKMAGWLDGIIQEARLEAEAAAYAAARLKEERKPGFRPGT